MKKCNASDSLGNNEIINIRDFRKPIQCNIGKGYLTGEEKQQLQIMDKHYLMRTKTENIIGFTSEVRKIACFIDIRHQISVFLREGGYLSKPGIDKAVTNSQQR